MEIQQRIGHRPIRERDACASGLIEPIDDPGKVKGFDLIVFECVGTAASKTAIASAIICKLTTLLLFAVVEYQPASLMLSPPPAPTKRSEPLLDKVKSLY